jgi:hypothetical protein
VRNGADDRLPRDGKSKLATHTARIVYREMLLQICMSYPGLPDPRTLTLAQIRFFYDGMRPSLHASTKQRPPTT